MRARNFAVLVLIVLAIPAAPARGVAQVRDSTVTRPPFGMRVAAGTLGSAGGALLGAGTGVLLAGDCTGEDIPCWLGPAALGLISGSIVGSVLGTDLLARHYGESPSVASELLGAGFGLLLGTAVGAGLTQLAPGDTDAAAFVVGVTLTQGTITAYASMHH